MRASDRRARFIGAEAYEAAGGNISRDLFQTDDGGWFQDPALLDRLVSDKLAAAAETVAAEGWKWISADIGFDYGHTRGLRALPSTSSLTDEEHATYEALSQEYAALEETYAEAEELPDEADQRLGEIEAALEDLAEVEAWLTERLATARRSPIDRAPHPDVRKRKARPVKAPDQARA